MAELINLGSTQAPYWEFTKVLQPNEHYKHNYVTDSFQLLDVSAPNALRVSMGGTMIQSPFTAGMGYRMSEPVEFVELWNDSASVITAHFVVGIGEIKDNRLTVSGTVLTRPAGGFTTYTATSTSGNSTTSYANNSQIDVICTSGTITLDNAAGVSGLTLSAGMGWSAFLANAGTLTISGTGSYNISVGNY